MAIQSPGSLVDLLKTNGEGYVGIFSEDPQPIFNSKAQQPSRDFLGNACILHRFAYFTLIDIIADSDILRFLRLAASPLCLQHLQFERHVCHQVRCKRWTFSLSKMNTSAKTAIPWKVRLKFQSM